MGESSNYVIVTVDPARNPHDAGTYETLFTAIRTRLARSISVTDEQGFNWNSNSICWCFPWK